MNFRLLRTLLARKEHSKECWKWRRQSKLIISVSLKILSEAKVFTTYRSVCTHLTLKWRSRYSYSCLISSKFAPWDLSSKASSTSSHHSISSWLTKTLESVPKCVRCLTQSLWSCQEAILDFRLSQRPLRTMLNLLVVPTSTSWWNRFHGNQLRCAVLYSL